MAKTFFAAFVRFNIHLIMRKYFLRNPSFFLRSACYSNQFCSANNLNTFWINKYVSILFLAKRIFVKWSRYIFIRAKSVDWVKNESDFCYRRYILPISNQQNHQYTQAPMMVIKLAKHEKSHQRGVTEREGEREIKKWCVGKWIHWLFR